MAEEVYNENDKGSEGSNYVATDTDRKDHETNV